MTPDVSQRVVQRTRVARSARMRDALARHAAFGLVLLLAAYLLTLNINLIWHTNHEDNGLAFESIAITQIRYGLSFTKGQDFYDPSVNPPSYGAQGIGPQGIDPTTQFQYFLSGPTHPVIYGHHPPLLGLTVAASFLIFGYHYWSERLVPIVYTLGALILFYLLMYLLFDPLVATFSAALFATFPITAYYGRDVAHEAPTLFWILGMLVCYALWMRTAQRRWLVALAVCVGVGAYYGWPMIYFACILFVVETLRRRRLHLGLLAATVGVALAMFALIVYQIYLAADGSLWTLQAVIFTRSGGSVAGGDTLLGWLGHLMDSNKGDFGAWTWGAAPLAIGFLIARSRREGLSPRLVAIVALGLGGVAHIAIWREAAYIHEYWQFYLIPFYAAAIGWAGVALARRISDLRGQDVAIVVALACVALLLSAPLIYNLYAGGLPYGPAAAGPVIPTLPISPHWMSMW